METLFHFLGFCPDSLGHIDVIDMLICYYPEIQNIITLIKFKFNS